MTSYAPQYHTIMAQQTPFETYGQEQYSDLVASSQGFASSAPYDTPLTTMDHNLGGFPLSAYSEQSRNDLFPIAGTGLEAHLAYSPAHSSADNLGALPRFSASSESGASVQSTSSSSRGSPHLNAQYSNEWHPMFTNALEPLPDVFFSSATQEQSVSKISGFVDPSVVAQPFTYAPVYPDLPPPTAAEIFDSTPSPAATASRTGKTKKTAAQANFSHFSNTTYPYHSQRRQSTSSSMSRNSSQRSGSFEGEEVEGGRGVCPIPDCGKSFKDLKAHMLTHQNERPEKCPISNCEYHVKGFARKYDKNRHTLTHYKGTMVCGFCPGSGSSAEKSFNRADVFKRHLTSVHGVEQVPPNARRKSASSRKSTVGQASGQCSTCSVTFPSAQEFYEHLDDCVLRVVQQIDPAEAINEKHLTTINEDKEVQDMLEQHNLTGTEYTPTHDEDDDEDDEEDDDNSRAQRSGKGTIKVKKATEAGAGTSWNASHRINKRRTGLTLSKGGVRLAGPAATSGRKKRKNYPASWGCSADKMRMKKRVMCAYDGQRRLWKDDLMLDSEYEVRVPLPSADGRAYITDLDMQTLRRVDAIYAATEEERGPWMPDNVIEADLDQIILA